MKKIILFLLSILFMLSIFIGISCKKTDDSDNVLPVITLSGDVPLTGAVGLEVTLPTATASDKKDGDISEKVKLTVALLKDDGSVQRELLFEVAGNKVQKFTPSATATSLKYKITYNVKNNAGKKAQLDFNFTASQDTEKPTLTLNSNSVSGFDITKGIEAKASEKIKLPSATAIDQPGNRDISSDVIVFIYETEQGVKNSNVFTYFEGTAEVSEQKLPMGEYIAEYTVKDGANNKAEEEISFSIKITKPDSENLIKDKSNFVYDNRDGMSWNNEYNELCFGHMPSREPLDQTVGFSLATMRIYDEIVGINFSADKPQGNGEMFYTISARGSKNRNTMPNTETCTWPNYLFLRIAENKIESRVERVCDKEMTIEKNYTGSSLIDGKQHSLYVQWVSKGASSTAQDAKIVIYGWVDKLPTSYELDYVSFQFSAKSGESNGLGTLATEAFNEMWGKESSGWFTMDTYCGSKDNFDEDHMKIASLVIYENGETDFDCDIVPPVVEVLFDNNKVFALNEEIVLPEANYSGETSKGLKIIFNNQETNITSNKYTPNAVGKYRILYWAKDASGNFGYKYFDINVAEKDLVKPVISLPNKDKITVALGEEIKIPTATASDNIDGDLSSKINIEFIGKQYEADLINGGSIYPMTVGNHVIRYSVSDSFANTAIEEIQVEVTGGTTGDMTGGNALTTTGGTGYRAKEYIYDQKVSMVLSVPKMGYILGFNLRGPIGPNGDWPDGLVLRLLPSGEISVSSKGHDSALFGTSSYSESKYFLNTESQILFEYKVSDILVNEISYLKIQVWIQGEELEFQKSGTQGEVDIEENSKAIYIQKSCFTGDKTQNIYSSPFWFTCPNGSANITELRIDGTSCTKPTGPIIPVGLNKPTFNTGNKELITTAVSLSAGDNSQTIGKYSNEDYIAITFKANEVKNKGAILFNITGNIEGWSGGLIFRITNDGIELRCVYANGDGDTVLRFNKNIYQNSLNTNLYTLVYKLTYNVSSDIVTSISVDAWIGLADGTLEKLIPSNQTNSKISWTEDGKVTIDYSLFVQSNIECGNISAWILGALNGEATWTVTKVEKLETAPQ